MPRPLNTQNRRHEDSDMDWEFIPSDTAGPSQQQSAPATQLPLGRDKPSSIVQIEFHDIISTNGKLQPLLKKLSLPKEKVETLHIKVCCALPEQAPSTSVVPGKINTARPVELPDRIDILDRSGKPVLTIPVLTELDQLPGLRVLSVDLNLEPAISTSSFSGEVTVTKMMEKLEVSFREVWGHVLIPKSVHGFLKLEVRFASGFPPELLRVYDYKRLEEAPSQSGVVARFDMESMLTDEDFTRFLAQLPPQKPQDPKAITTLVLHCEYKLRISKGDGKWHARLLDRGPYSRPLRPKGVQTKLPNLQNIVVELEIVAGMLYEGLDIDVIRAIKKELEKQVSRDWSHSITAEFSHAGMGVPECSTYHVGAIPRILRDIHDVHEGPFYDGDAMTNLGERKCDPQY